MLARPAALVLAVLAAAAPCANAGDEAHARAIALMRTHKCYICHSDDEPFAGPAFADVAAGYRGMANAESTIARFILRGEHGNAPWHMPPHPELSQDDARDIARYILSLDRPAPPANATPPAIRAGVPARSPSSPTPSSAHRGRCA